MDRAMSASSKGCLFKGGAVITVDPELGVMPCADVRIRNGAIDAVGRDLEGDDLEVIDATGMIVMPGLVDTHCHMWSTVGRNFTADDGFGYYPVKWATAHLYSPEDFHASVLLGFAELANGGVTTVHNWSHNSRSSAHVDAELCAHEALPLRARYSLGHIEGLAPDTLNLFPDLPRIQNEWFSPSGRLNGLVSLGLNLRGMVQSEAAVFHQEMEMALRAGLPVSIHATQSRPNLDDAANYERRGYLGPNFLFCHYVAASQSDRDAMARTGTPLSFATLSEMRLGHDGDPRRAFLNMRAAGVLISLSSDAASIAPMNMLEAMRVTWNMAVPHDDAEPRAAELLSFAETIEMATLNGAKALGLGAVTGSLTPGKRVDIIMINTNEVNIAPAAHPNTTVVQSATPANVDTVMVDGRILKRGGKLVGIDVEAIVAAAKGSALRIRSAVGGALAPRCSCGTFIRSGSGASPAPSPIPN
jgi:5-methylthioadenosine/S-adenosylhomocysteine deaminase